MSTRQHPRTSQDDEPATVRAEFHEVVNIPATKLERWLETGDSRLVGAKAGVASSQPGGPESVGHRSGRRIVRLLGKTQAELTAGDYAHMRKVIAYVRRHLAQKPEHEPLATSRWRYSLMNWGHDPLH